MAWSYIVAVAYLIICLVDGHDGVMRTVVDGVITRTSLPPATAKPTRSLLTFESVTLHPPNDTSDTVDTHYDLPNPQITIALPEEETTATTKAASTTRFRSIFSEETVDSRKFMTIALPGEEPTTDAAPDTTTTTTTNFQPAVDPLKVVTAGLSNDDTTTIPTSVPTNNTSTETKEDLTRFATIAQPGANSTSTTLTITSALNPVNSSEAIDEVPKLLTVAFPEKTITTTGAPIQPINPSTKTTTQPISTTAVETTQTTTTNKVEPHRLVTISVPAEGTTTSTTTATKGPAVGSAVAVARLPVAVWLASLPEVSQSRDQNIPIEDITVEKPQKKDNPTLHSQEVTRRSSFAPTTTPTIATTTTSYLNSDEQITVNLMNKDLFTDSVDITANETLTDSHSLNTVTSSNTTQYSTSIPTTSTTTAATKEPTRLASSATTTVPHTTTSTVLTTTTSTAQTTTTTPIPVTFTTLRSTTTTAPVLTTTRTVPTMITRPPPILRTAKLRPRLRTTTALPTTVWSVRASMRKPLVRKIHHTSRRIKHRKGLRKFRGKYHRRPLHRNRHQKLRRKFAGNFSTRRRVSKKHLSSRMARLNSLRLRRRLQGSRPHLIELYGRTSVPPVHHRARTPVPHRAWTRRDRSKRQTHMLAQADINSAENRMRSAIDIINKLHDSEENDADPIFDKLQKDSWAPSESVMVRPLLPPQN